MGGWMVVGADADGRGRAFTEGLRSRRFLLAGGETMMTSEEEDEIVGDSWRCAGMRGGIICDGITPVWKAHVQTIAGASKKGEGGGAEDGEMSYD